MCSYYYLRIKETEEKEKAAIYWFPHHRDTVVVGLGQPQVRTWEVKPVLSDFEAGAPPTWTLQHVLPAWFALAGSWKWNHRPGTEYWTLASYLGS